MSIYTLSFNNHFYALPMVETTYILWRNYIGLCQDLCFYRLRSYRGQLLFILTGFKDTKILTLILCTYKP